MSRVRELGWGLVSVVGYVLLIGAVGMAAPLVGIYGVVLGGGSAAVVGAVAVSLLQASGRADRRRRRRSP